MFELNYCYTYLSKYCTVVYDKLTIYLFTTDLLNFSNACGDLFKLISHTNSNII